MQRNDTIDSSKQRRVGGRDQSSGQQDPVQHFVLTSQLQALTGQGRLSLIPGLTSTTSPVSVSPGTQVNPSVTLSTPLQHQTAVVVTSQDLGRLLTAATVAGTSTTETSSPVLSAQTLQRQLSGQGIVGVLGPGRQQGTSALVTRSVPAGTTELQIAQPLTIVTTSTSGATGNQGIVSGGTVHHHGQSPSRGAQPTPRPNLQQTSIKMNTQTNTQQPSPRTSTAAAGSTGSTLAAAAAGKVLQETKPVIAPTGLSHTFPNLTALANQAGLGPSPKKKIKMEEKAPATQDIANNRKLLLDQKYKEMLEIKENYIEYLTELFFLQNGGNLMDYFAWKKRPTPQLVHFLKSGNLDSDEEEDHGQERKINNEVKVITCSGSNVPLATPVAIATTLPPSVAALNQQATTTGFETRRPGGRHGMVFGHVQPVIAACTPSSSVGSGIIPSSQVTTSSLSIASTSLIQSTVVSSSQTNAASNPRLSTSSVTSISTITSTTNSVSMPQLQSQLARVITETKPLSVHTGHVTKSTMSPPASSQSSPALRTPKTPPTSPGGTLRIHTRQGQISAVYDGAIGSQEAIVERAKQEAQVMQRVAELRKEGLWSSRRLPKVQEPPRNKGHWDYLLEEMQWLAADFQQERKWKKAAARKVAKMVSKYFQELEQKEMKAEKEEGQKLKRIAGQLAKQIREFWTNIEKVVQYKHQTRMEEKRKKALDIHLNFIVDQTEKYSTWLTEGLKKGKGGSSVSTTPDQSVDGADDEFEPEDDDADDEETIEKAEEDLDDESTKAELDALQKEGEVPIEELLQSLPKEVLDKPASLHEDEQAEDDSDKDSKNDKEFTASEEEEIDVEETIEEQEKLEKKADYSSELKDLEDEGDMDMEELYKKYAGAYDSDFEMPESSDTEDEDDESTDEEDEEEEEEEEEDTADDKDVGLEFLMNSENSSQENCEKVEAEEKGPGKEITDIAAEAQSLQPKGYTLQTTEVKTQVPFLIRGTLREYQHVGLDWLATMYEKRLNGILADEMGLGKTIQTIALLAHLACDKGIWGPHLIVVPTSVMLNWELEIKKWCPAFKILTYYGNVKERKLKRQGWTKTNAFHVCITSYKLVIQDHQSFRRKKWKYFILDEAQNIKNFKSQRWQTLLNFSSQRRLLLTGTPLQNSLMELWSLMHFLMPNVFQSHREFKEWFANPLTGMIEGSHEYNESLIRRLHKVLRPFLLRRLKADVEKQMPKKYEHVVMCHLSKRQRFLYDEFMSQTKTKETLASGHFMSVINILMQLRKVCNHPSLFDPRPIISPFQTEGIVYHTASLVLHAIKYDPFKNIDIRSLYPSLSDMELDLPAFIAHRVKRLQTPKKLIEEIDDQPDPEPRPQPGRLKPVTFRSLSPMIQSGRSSPVVTSSEANVSNNATTTVQMTASSQPSSSVVSTGSVTHPSSTVPVTTSNVISQSVHSTLQAKVVPQGQSSQQVTTSQPITVQIQQTEQGARLMIPAGQLSQLPAGFIQIVQTSMGQQIIATSNPVTTSAQQRVSSPSVTSSSSLPAVSVTTSSTTLVNGLPTITTVATMSPITTVTSVATQVRTTPTIQLPSTTTAAAQKPVMRVSPLVSEPVTMAVTKVGQVSTTMSTTSVRMSVAEEIKPVTRSAAVKESVKCKKRSEFDLDYLCARRQQRRKEKLEYIARINKIHCEQKPVYGQDLCWTVNVLRDMECTCTKDNTWRGMGYVHCYNVHTPRNPHHPDCFWHQTKVLSSLVHTPIQYLHELEEILSRFVFATPPVTSPRIRMHVSHPPPSVLMEDRQREFLMQREVSPKASCLHKISTNRIVQFPELRLIQYDCGKLQVLDILLRRLKSGQHRVLIFTQMTKMLDVLESFLNYHGHRYLRLDGTTRVEQRQMLMDRFNADKRIFVFILSTRSGGIGVNLTGADTVIFYDSDWNPTMDAQAQDRCHRIGQTRDVHIYRLISERTVEENILKKANQKRMLGDMAIEGGNFTTAFFKEQTIKELFSEPSGLDSLVKQKQVEEKQPEEPVKEIKQEVKIVKEKIKTEKEGSPAPVAPKSENIVAQFEQALEKAEDETDVVAANLVKAEQKAELAEFDENIPWDEREAERRKEEEETSRAEQELAMLEKELSPVERYAVGFMEQEMDPTDELQMAEEDIESSKKDWELARLKALKEEEERRLEIEEDEMLYTFSRDDAYNQVKKKPRKSKPYMGCSGLIPTISLSPPRAVGPGRRKSAGKVTPANKGGASKPAARTPRNATVTKARGGKTPTIDVENSSDEDDDEDDNITSSEEEMPAKAKPKAGARKKTVKTENEGTKSVGKKGGSEESVKKVVNKGAVAKAADNVMKKVRNKVIKVCDITVPASPVKSEAQVEVPPSSVPVNVNSPLNKTTQRQARQVLQKQLKDVKAAAAALLKQQQAASSNVQTHTATIPSPMISTPLSIPSPQSRKQPQVLTVQQMAAQQGLTQVGASPVLNIASHSSSSIQSSSAIQQVVHTPQGKVSVAATPQPQLLTPSQLQHLKQIISQAHHNMQHQPPPPSPVAGNKISLKSIPQPVFSQQQAILQVPQPVQQIITPAQHQTYQVVQQAQGGAPTIAQVVPQSPQQVQVLKHASGAQQLLTPSGQQAVQLVTQSQQQIPVGSSTMAHGIQQVVATPSNSAQPTLSFIKVSGNSTAPPQPVIQYCVNSVGSSQAVRIQSPQIAGPAPQQGVVLLQLAGGKAVPVSMAGNPVGLPVARMMGNKTVVQQGQLPAQRIRQVIPQGSTVIAQQPQVVTQQPQVVTQNQVHSSPVNSAPQAPRLSMPTSRFQTPNHTQKTKPIQRVPVPAIINAPFTLVTAAEQPVVNKAAVAPVALLGAKKVQNVNNSPKENSNHNTLLPWSNPNLVIRTRRAVMQEQNDKGDAEFITSSTDMNTQQISLDSIPVPVQQTFSVDQVQNSQFISLIKANAMPVVPVGANVTIGIQGSPQKTETILTIPQPHLTHLNSSVFPSATENGGGKVSLSDNG